MRRKLGLAAKRDEDAALIEDWLALMQRHRADYTLAFRELCDAAEGPAADAALARRFGGDAAAAAWLARWRRRLGREARADSARAAGMRRANPARIPRNHRVEQAIAAAVERADFTATQALVEALSEPHRTRPELARYASPPSPEERVLQTFCGT